MSGRKQDLIWNDYKITSTNNGNIIMVIYLVILQYTLVCI